MRTGPMTLSINGILADNRCPYDVLVNESGTSISAVVDPCVPSSAVLRDAVHSAFLKHVPAAVDFISPEVEIQIAAKVDKFAIRTDSYGMTRWCAEFDFRAEPETVDVTRHWSLPEKRVLTNR